MTTQSAGPKPGNNQLGLLFLAAAVLAAVVGVGRGVGLGASSTLAALIALFCALAAFGGPLRSDLRLLAWLGPGMIVATAVPRLLAEVSAWLAIALITIIVFVAGLIPALGDRYTTVGMGLGMATLFSYGMKLTGTADALQLVGASVVAVVFVVVWRVVAGLKDPTKQTRNRIATVFDGEQPQVPAALRTWLGDRPARWSGTVLASGARYRLTAEALRGGRHLLDTPAADHVRAVLDTASECASGLAEAVRARRPAEPPTPELPEPGDLALPRGTRELLADLDSELATAREHVGRRDTGVLGIPRAARREVVAGEVAGALSWRSARLRHALRCAVGLFAALVLTLLRPGDPLIVAFLLTTFGILQVSWQDTLARARQRVVGVLIGALVLTAALLVLPPVGLLPLALVALLVGFWFMQSRPVVFSSAMVLVAVSLNATARHLDPGRTLVEYVVLVVIGVAIGLLFGFAVVPGIRTPTLPERLDVAVTDTRSLLETLAAHAAAPGRGTAAELLRAGRIAATAQQDLATAARTASTDTGRENVDDVGAILRGMTFAATALALRPDEDTAETLRTTARGLDQRAGSEDERLETGHAAKDAGGAATLLHVTLASHLHQLRRALGTVTGTTADARSTGRRRSSGP